MMDRASKLQDVVYFSQQVHLYNQHVICNLNNVNHQPVMLSHVMSTTSVNEFLGGKKSYSYKVPFHLNLMDITMRQKNFCDAPEYENAIDDTNWDSPLNRLPDARAAFRILKHSYAVRDQGVQVTTSEIKLNEMDTIYNHSQTDKKRDIYQKQEEKPIKQSVVVDNRFDSKTKKDLYQSSTVTKPINNKPQSKSNPVLELQSRGKQYQSNNANEDDPPYNFQAMLKKTNNNKRPSIKGLNVQFSSDIPDDADGSFISKSYADGRRPEPAKRTRDIERPVEDNVKLTKDFKNELNQQLSKATRTELLPGVMLEGSSYDL